jgi:hypothetical protein
MFVGTFATYKLLLLFLSPASKSQSLIIIGICALVGAGIYVFLSYRTKLVYLLFGQRAEKIKQKLRLPF